VHWAHRYILQFQTVQIAAKLLLDGDRFPPFSDPFAAGITPKMIVDSVAFGYSPLLDPSNPDNFVGYPSIVAQLADGNVTNASCLGETSGSFISPTGTDNGCVCSAPFFHSTSRTAERSSTLPISFLLSHPRTAW
jgi:hypothetical protein